MNRFEVREDGYNYPEKPANAKTVVAWRRENRTPISDDCIEYFKMPSDPTRAYAYVRFENTVELDKSKDFFFTPNKKNDVYRQIDYQNKKTENALREAYSVYQKNPIVFDTETTGFSPKMGDEILQISVTDKDGNILLDTYLRPIEKTSWPNAERVHGISYDDVKESPIPFEIQPEIKMLFENASAIVGHNVSFDMRFMEATFNLHIPEEKLVDTMKLVKDVFPGGKYKLENAVQYFCQEYMEEYTNGAHDSCTDAIATSKVLKSMANLYEKEYAKEESKQEDFEL